MQCPPSDVAPPVDLETDLAQARGQGPGPQRDDAQHADHQEDRGFHGDAPYHSDLERGHRQPDGHEESLEREVLSLRREMSRVSDDKERLEQQVERLLTERDAIKLKVEGMLDAIAVLDVEAAKSGSS